MCEIKELKVYDIIMTSHGTAVGNSTIHLWNGEDPGQLHPSVNIRTKPDKEKHQPSLQRDRLRSPLHMRQHTTTPNVSNNWANLILQEVCEIQTISFFLGRHDKIFFSANSDK